ncbi:MAG: DUF2382 domain-containing protein [Roseiarcus sp.]
MPLVEERLEVKKRTVMIGRVRVVTHTETVEEIARVVLDGEEADVQTVELDQPIVGPVPRVRTEGGWAKFNHLSGPVCARKFACLHAPSD